MGPFKVNQKARKIIPDSILGRKQVDLGATFYRGPPTSPISSTSGAFRTKTNSYSLSRTFLIARVAQGYFLSLGYGFQH